MSITDPAGTIQYANPAFERVTGYRREEALGRNPRFLRSGRQDEDFYRGLWATVLAGGVWQGRMTNRRKDGGLYEQQTTISPVRDGSGTVVNLVAVSRDVTREAALEAQLRQVQKLDELGRLAGGVAHDFNNLLTVILSCTEALRTDLAAGKPPSSEDVEQIDRGVPAQTTCCFGWSFSEACTPISAVL